MEKDSGKGLDYVIILTIVFVVLKLTDTIDWSWWWVLSPMLIRFGVFFLLALIAMLYVVVSDMVKKIRNKLY
jgi:phosphoglycerol transferase MdoB-like AlkP superfamily enzyme